MYQDDNSTPRRYATRFISTPPRHQNNVNIGTNTISRHVSFEITPDIRHALVRLR